MTPEQKPQKRPKPEDVLFARLKRTRGGEAPLRPQATAQQTSPRFARLGQKRAEVLPEPFEAPALLSPQMPMLPAQEMDAPQYLPGAMTPPMPPMAPEPMPMPAPPSAAPTMDAGPMPEPSPFDLYEMNSRGF